MLNISSIWPWSCLGVFIGWNTRTSNGKAVECRVIIRTMFESAITCYSMLPIETRLFLTNNKLISIIAINFRD